MNFNKKKITGFIAAPFTPMFEDGSVNVEVIAKYATKLKEDGLSGVFINGTTGEGMLMSLCERKQVAEAWLKHQSDNFHVIVHVGSTSVKQSAELAAHAEVNGAFAVGCMGPCFLPPSTASDLVRFCEEVAGACPNTPFYYYHMPATSNVTVSMLSFLELAEERISNLAGIKFTHNNLMEMRQCIQYKEGKFDILHGYDEILLSGLAMGAKGGVGSTYNYIASVYLSLRDAFEKGDIAEAQRLQDISIKVVEVLIKYGGGVIAGKAIMNLIGIECGPCRAHLPYYGQDVLDNINKDLKEIGFYEIS
ncbi:dihydrodipicolinate synthase family protein [Halosquirtibacter xylanolyticus]|uniref:dihydrodipicolinate synthase family protein n=1 Tax=Halosquirtibacter xylanolyticus TaxID=3374599 RepID=UPI0037488B0F|nr:dihydrodipicolinate synthase family protein [Prolixibacteraceae bacterium]